MSDKKKLVVIGGGSGGLAAAKEASKLGCAPKKSESKMQINSIIFLVIV